MLHSVLLVEHHANDDRERVLIEYLVSGSFACDLKSHSSHPLASMSNALERNSEVRGPDPELDRHFMPGARHHQHTKKYQHATPDAHEKHVVLLHPAHRADRFAEHQGNDQKG